MYCARLTLGMSTKHVVKQIYPQQIFITMAEALVFMFTREQCCSMQIETATGQIAMHSIIFGPVYEWIFEGSFRRATTQMLWCLHSQGPAGRHGAHALQAGSRRQLYLVHPFRLPATQLHIAPCLNHLSFPDNETIRRERKPHLQSTAGNVAAASRNYRLQSATGNREARKPAPPRAGRPAATGG